MVFSVLMLAALQPQASALATLYEKELARVEAVHGAMASETGNAARDLGLFLLRQGNPGAIPALQRALGILNDTVTRESLAQALVMAKRGAEAMPLYQALSESKDPKVAARALTALGDLQEQRSAACALYEKAIGMDPSIPRLNDLGLCLRESGKLKAAILQFRRALTLDANSKSPDTAVTLNNLASALLEAKQTAEAELHQRRAFALLVKHLGPNQPRTALSESNLADILRARGKMAEARRHYHQALRVFSQQLGPTHPWTREAQEALESTPRP